MNKFLSFIAIIALAFSSCSGPLSKKYSPETYEDDMQAIRKSDKVDEGDMELLAKYIIVSRLAGNDLQGKTYDDILDKIKDIKKNNDALLSEQKNEEEYNRQKFARLLKVSLPEKGFSKIDNKDHLTYTVVFTNTSGRDIETVIGNITINDLLDNEIKKIDILLDQPLKTGATFKKIFAVAYDHANENDQRIRMKDLVDMRVEWNPQQVVFEKAKTER